MEAFVSRGEHARTPAAPRPRGLLARVGDERLVARVRGGDEAAFEALYDRYHRGMLSFCRHMLGSHDEAEDAVQQTFISAYHDLRRNDREINLKPWLYTIARNRCLSILRARREQPTETLELSTAGLSEDVQHRADLRELLADLRELPEPQRASLVLSELGDLSHSDVARILDCETAKVKSLVFQARSALHERRQARETPCHEIREQLATLRGGSLRRGPLRRHVRACPGCAGFRDEVRRQRQAMALVLPVIPSVGLKETALASAGIGAAGGGGAAAGGLGGGALAGLAAKAGAVKLAAVVAAGGVATGGAVAVVDREAADSPARQGAPPPLEQRQSGTERSSDRSGLPGLGWGGQPARPARGSEGASATGRRRAKRRRGGRRGAPAAARGQGQGPKLSKRAAKPPAGRGRLLPPGQAQRAQPVPGGGAPFVQGGARPIPPGQSRTPPLARPAPKKLRPKPPGLSP